MYAQGMAPLVFSIREAEQCSGRDFPAELVSQVQYLPPSDEIAARTRQLQAERKIPKAMNRVLREWGKRDDRHRVYTAAHLGPVLRRAGVRHVHTHFAGIGARSAYWLKKFYGISYSFTSHANDIFCETDFPVSLRDLLSEASFVATVSDFSRKWLGRKFPEFQARIHRVYNGIEVEKFRSKPHEEGPLRIVSVGRYIEKKGFSYLIEACRQLRDGGAAFSCRIIGTGPLEQALNDQIQGAGLKDMVVLTGPRNEDQVIEEMAEADLFVLPCVVEEGGGMDNLPTVIMEAMASTLPVISTRVAGVPEMVTESESGFLVAPNDASALAAAIRPLIGNPSQLAAMGVRGRQLALERFSTPVTTRQLKRLLVRYGRVSLPWTALTGDRALAGDWLRRKFLLR